MGFEQMPGAGGTPPSEEMRKDEEHAKETGIKPGDKSIDVGEEIEAAKETLDWQKLKKLGVSDSEIEEKRKQWDQEWYDKESPALDELKERSFALMRKGDRATKEELDALSGDLMSKHQLYEKRRIGAGMTYDIDHLFELQTKRDKIAREFYDYLRKEKDIW